MRSLEAVFNQNISLEQACAEAYTFTLDTNHAVELIELLAAASIIEKSQLSSSIIERLSVNYNQVSYVAKELINDGVAINSVYIALRPTQLVGHAIITDHTAN